MVVDPYYLGKLGHSYTVRTKKTSIQGSTGFFLHDHLFLLMDVEDEGFLSIGKYSLNKDHQTCKAVLIGQVFSNGYS